jgi:hypothetical protein
VAGACTTILKAYFDERSPLQPLEHRPPGGGAARFFEVREAINNGCNTQQHGGMTLNQLTVRDEVDKLASNVGTGRMCAGVHWRTDHIYSLLLGEMVAVSLLIDQALTFSEEHYFEFTTFLGEQIRITRLGIGRRGASGRSSVSLCDDTLGTLIGCL